MSFWGVVLDDKTVAVVTWLGTLGGGLGLYYTFIQAKSAREAAHEARDAVAALEGRVSIGSLAYAYSQIDMVKDLVHSGELRSAHTMFNPVKRAVLEICGGIALGHPLFSEVAVIRRNIKLVESQLGRGLTDRDTMSVSKLSSALSGIATFIIEREQELKYTRDDR